MNLVYSKVKTNMAPGMQHPMVNLDYCQSIDFDVYPDNSGHEIYIIRFLMLDNTQIAWDHVNEKDHNDNYNMLCKIAITEHTIQYND